MYSNFYKMLIALFRRVDFCRESRLRALLIPSRRPPTRLPACAAPRDLPPRQGSVEQGIVAAPGKPTRWRQQPSREAASATADTSGPAPLAARASSSTGLGGTGMSVRSERAQSWRPWRSLLFAFADSPSERV